MGQIQGAAEHLGAIRKSREMVARDATCHVTL